MGTSSLAKQESNHQLQAFKWVVLVERTDATKPPAKSMLVRLPVSSRQSYDSWTKQTASLSKEGCVLLPEGHSFQTKGFCMAGGEAVLQYPDYSYDLDREWKHRMATGQTFRADELFYIMFTLLDAATQYETTNSRAGDIQLTNMLFNESGQMKLLGQQSHPQFSCTYRRLLQGEPCRPSPEELACARDKKIIPIINNSIAECFSIGVVLLQLTSLRDCDQLYDFTNFTFNWERAHAFLRRAAEEGLPPLLAAFIESMLRDQFTRPSCGELFSLLLPYEDQILDLRPFNYDRARAQADLQSYRSGIVKLSHFSNYNLTERASPFSKQSPPLQMERPVPVIAPHRSQTVSQGPMTVGANQRLSIPTIKALPNDPRKTMW